MVWCGTCTTAVVQSVARSSEKKPEIYAQQASPTLSYTRTAVAEKKVFWCRHRNDNTRSLKARKDPTIKILSK